MKKIEAHGTYQAETGNSQGYGAADILPAPPKTLGKKYLKGLFRTLKTDSYPIYALIAHLSLRYFSIERTYNYRQSMDGKEDEGRDIFRLHDFSTNAAAFHRYDEFCIRFGENTLRYEAETNSETFERLFDNFLKYVCELSMRRNIPLALDRAMINKYKLNKIDAESVGKHLDHINVSVKEKLQREYDALKKLDCIRR